jgi:hypothetical protein
VKEKEEENLPELENFDDCRNGSDLDSDDVCFRKALDENLKELANLYEADNLLLGLLGFDLLKT